MLLPYIFLLSCCLSGSMGSAISEFQENFQALVKLADEKIFLLVPPPRFQCNLVPCHLERTTQQLKNHSRNDQMRTHASLMEKKLVHIISSLNETYTKPRKDGSCPMTEMALPGALKCYKRYFEKLEEMC